MTRLIQICVILLVCVVFVHGDIPDHTCFTPNPIRSLDGSENNAWIGSYVGYVEDVEDLTTAFGRVVDTGSGGGLIPNGDAVLERYSNKRTAVRQHLSRQTGYHRVGAFFCNSTYLDNPSYVPLIILTQGAYIKPEKRTQTVSFGETVTINMKLNNGNVTDLRWRLNEAIVERWLGMANVTIENVTKDDAGIYECYLNNGRNESKHAIMRLIVRGCSAARWGPDCQNLCPTCYNGGVCDDVTGLCICPPGFNTTDCSLGCGDNRWGRNCSIVCSSSKPGCRGNLACVPDPLGCSCMAGYGGLNCKKGCDEIGKYGSTCSEECHCADGVVCNSSIGCPNGPCADGYSGKNCQVPDTCPNGRYGELCKYYCHCEDDGPCNRTTGSCGERKCRHLWIGNDCQLDGRTNISLIIPESNVGAAVSITCIVQSNPIPNDEDIQVLDNNNTLLEGGVSTVVEYTRTVVYSNVSVAKGDVFICQVNSSSVAGDAPVEKNVIVYDPPVLTTPPQVTASDTSVTVTWDRWTESDGNGDGPVIGYQVCYSMINSSLICNKSVLNLTASFVIDSNDEIQRGLEYFFIVRAIRPGYLGEGRFTQPTSFTIPCLSPEVAPTYVDGSSLGISEIQVQWQLIDAEHWRCNSLDDYEVEYKKSGSHIFQNVTSTDTSVKISNLEPCTNYEIRVRATNSGGAGPSTEIVMVTTDAQEPDSVKDARITAASSRSLLVTWEAPDIHGCEIDFYKVEYQLQNPGMCGENLGNVEGPLNTTSTSIEIDNLEVYSQYSITICPVIGEMGGNDNLEGPETTVNGSTVEEKPTGKPLAVVNQVRQQTELSFTWQPPACGKRNGPITKYKSRLKLNSTTVEAKQVSELSVTFSSLLPCTEYTFQVKAANGEDLFGPWSDVLHVQTASQEPDSVNNARITEASNSSLQVMWEAPDIHGCEIDFYKVEYQLENPGMCGENLGNVEGPLNTTSTSIEIPNLEVYSQYSVTIRAVIGQVGGTDNLEGSGTTVRGTTGEAEPLAGPWNIRTLVIQEATNDIRGEIKISFGSVPCEKKKGEILNYTVQVIDGDGNENTMTVDASPATITGGFPCESVIPQVAACTSAGCGVFANGPNIKMNIAAPGKISVDVKSQPSKSRKLHISWSEPEVVHCPIVEYKIKYRLTHLDQCQEQNNEFKVYVVDNTETEYTLTGLAPFSTYEVVVYAGVDGMNGNTTFTPGQTAFANTTSRVPERGPKEVYDTSVSATVASFAWSQIECGYRNGHIRGYRFSLQNADIQELIKNNSETTELQCKVEDLKPYTKYIFSVRGFNSKGNGKISKGLNITTKESFPSVVRNIGTLNTDTKSFRIKWSRPEPPNGIVIRYQINYTEIDRFENNTWSVHYYVSDEERDTIDFNFIIGNLQPNTNYSLQAVAFTSVGIGPWSDEFYVFTTTGKPGPVHKLYVEYAKETDIYMKWKNPLNPNGAITNYYVQYRILEKIFEPDAEIQLEWVKPHSVGVSLTCLLSNLEPATTYEIRVFAETSAGSGEPSNVNYTTLTPPVKNYPKLSVISQTDTTVKVKLEPIPNFIYVSKYAILVDKAAGAKRRNADGSHEYGRHEDSPDKYVTATFPRDEVPEEFTVGDNKTYGGYRNAPLVKDKIYGLSFAVDNGNNEYQTDGKDPKMIKAGAPKPFKPEGSPVALIIGLVMFFLMAIVVLGMFLVIKRRRGGIRAKPMFPMSHITSEKRLTNAPSEDTLADTVNGKQPPISQKPANLKAARVHRPVKVEHLAAYVKKKRMHQNEGFQSDFESLPDQQMYSWDVAKKSENKTKNRYGNIIAYDHCRVVLEPVPGDPHSDYINACYIDGYNQKNAYIATQGPNTASVQDIWRMVWQEGCSVIVMVTNLSEGGKKKCEKYWPDNTQTYAGIDVKTIAEEDYPQYTVRTFKITKNDEVSREVKQFHFTVWPDMGVPEFANDILRFIDVVKENGSEKTGPTVVHCSAGVGRTGTLIAISEMLDMAREEGRINVFNFVHQMRTHRVKMVQTADQYFFIFDALLEAVVCGPTSAKAADMNSFYNNLLLLNPLTKRSYILEQYNALEAMSVVTTEENTKGGKMPDNISKNRFPEQVPIDGSRPYLMTLSSETGTNYINASFLHGYHGKDMYIATQMPMPNTVADFWCMVYDYKSKLILMLNEEASQDQTHGKYWPDSGCVQHGPMSIEHTSTVKSATAICRTFTLTNTLRMKEEPRQIKQYQYLGWLGSKTPASVESVLEFLKLLDGEGSENTDPPITVHCMNGIERCGLFCTIHSVFQRLQKEHIVDVFHTIRKLRRSRASMVAPVTQFEFCFTTVRCYLDAFEIYSNYK